MLAAPFAKPDTAELAMLNTFRALRPRPVNCEGVCRVGLVEKVCGLAVVVRLYTGVAVGVFEMKGRDAADVRERRTARAL